jgi:hypothetical protein
MARLTERELLRRIAARPAAGPAAAVVARRVLKLAKELDSIFEFSEIGVSVQQHVMTRSGLVHPTLVLVAEEGTFWIRENESWARDDATRDIAISFRTRMRKWFGDRVLGHPTSDRRKAPDLRALGRRWDKFDSLLRQTVAGLRALEAPVEAQAEVGRVNVSLGKQRPAAKSSNTGKSKPSRARTATSRRTQDEHDWLHALAGRVRARIDASSVASRVTGLIGEVEGTDPSSDGWWVSVGSIGRTACELCLFVDNSGERGQRAFWYGISARTEDAIAEVEQAGWQRWPHTKIVEEGDSQLDGRYDDPWLQRYRRGEYYYGCSVPEVPNFVVEPSLTIVAQVAERFRALLTELQGSVQSRDPVAGMDALDRLREVKQRLEQHLVRQLLLGKRSTGECALCGETFPAAFLVAAHIKRRADCEPDERRDHANNVMALCSLGCDSLFERGHLVVRKGLIERGSMVPKSGVVAHRVSELQGRKCKRWSKANAKYFAAHRERFEQER